MEEEFYDACAVVVKMVFEIPDRPVPALPNRFLAILDSRQALIAQDFRMNPNDQDFLIVGSIENTDPAAFRQLPCCSP